MNEKKLDIVITTIGALPFFLALLSLIANSTENELLVIVLNIKNLII